MAHGRLVGFVNWLGINAAVLGVLGVAALGVYKSRHERRQAYATAASLTGGDPRVGRSLVDNVGCAACHTIPGIHRANATVGPPLKQFAGRSYIAGVLPNTPDNLFAWLDDPPAIVHGSAMPRLNLTPRQNRDIGAFLYTLK